MKMIILLNLMIFSNPLSARTYRHECDEFRNQLSMTIGTYKFKTNKLCKEVHKVAKDCQSENARLAGLNNNYKRVDCLQLLLGFMDKHKNEMTRIGNTVFVDTKRPE